MKTAIRIDKPCNADWSTMDGDARRRMCALCDKHVHDLSALREAEAEKLVQNASGRLCVRYRADADGRIVHRPARTSRVARFAFAAVGVVAALPAFASGKTEAGATWSWIAEVVESLAEQVAPEPMIMGEMAMVEEHRAVTNLTGAPIQLLCPNVEALEIPAGERAEVDTWPGATCSVTGAAGTVQITATMSTCSRTDAGFTCASTSSP